MVIELMKEQNLMHEFKAIILGSKDTLGREKIKVFWGVTCFEVQGCQQVELVLGFFLWLPTDYTLFSCPYPVLSHR